jgi:energy-coupling factor transport system substrate-specific component
MKTSLREILLLGLLSAVLVIVQVGLSFLPNIELVSLLIIVFTLVLGKKAFYPIYVFVIAEGLIFGFSLWWYSYLYIWSILAIVVLLLRKNDNMFIWSIISGVFGLCFGALTAFPYLLTQGIGGAIAYWVSGIPFDLLHCAGNVAAAVLLLRPLYKIMIRLYHNRKTSRPA